MSRLDACIVDELLQALTGWKHSNDRGGIISREFVFADFADAFSFMTLVALWAEQRDHHPEWSNLYNRVSITLTTHDVNGLSMNDIEMARLMNRAFARVTVASQARKGASSC